MHKKMILAVAMLALLPGCAPMSDATANRALTAAGYTHIELHGMAFFGCGEKDFLRKSFTAVSANGTQVSGVVCGGFLKGATVRTD